MGKRILILSNHFITLYNFRRELIEELVRDNNQVFISMPNSSQNSFFEAIGCKIIDTPVNRRGLNPLNDIQLFIKYLQIMNSIKPDVILSYTIKPNIYGSLASNLIKIKQINNVTGTGATFLEPNLVSSIVKKLYKISLKKSYKVFFQNSGDQKFFLENGMVKDNFDLLPGSGVNLKEYHVTDYTIKNTINFIFIGRVMNVKGIDQYLECALTIKKKYPQTNFYVAGFIEEERYREIIETYHERGIINYIGFQKDIKEWIEKSHCTILPSYGGEGVPNVLLESAAMGRVCIASNISGSNDVIEDGVTGYLFTPKKSIDLIKKVTDFLNLSDDAKKQMGINARVRVEKKFDRQIILEAYQREIDKI